jgi:predicted ATPase
VIDTAIERARANEEGWCLPELLRIKGQLVLIRGASCASAAAESLFLQALDLAHKQGALAWELRAATSLARLRDDPAYTQDSLLSVYSRFTEGFSTHDLQEAKTLLDRCG